MSDWVQNNKDIIGVISGIIWIFLFLWWFIYGLYKNLNKEKIKIKSFWLKLEDWKNYQSFDFIEKYKSFKLGKINKVSLKEDILKENFIFSGLYSYRNPEFEILFINNSDHSYVLKNFEIKINKIYDSITPLIWITFSWKQIWFDQKEINWSYNNLFFDFENLWYSFLEKIKISDVLIYDSKWNKIKNQLNVKNNLFNLNIKKEQRLEFELLNKNTNFSISKIIFILNLEIQWKKVNHQILYTIWEWEWWIFFHNKGNWFYMINWELGWGWFESDDIWKYLIPVSLWFNKLEWKRLYYPLKRLIETKNIDNFSFYLGVDFPCKIEIDLIFNFWNYIVTKRLIIDYSFPITFELEEFKNKSNIFLIKNEI